MISRYKLLPDFDSRARVGILGGSFNPAHEGHRYITIEAIKMLNLDYVIWLVSPHNPSKDKNILQPLEDRVRYAKKISNHKKIIITDIEKFFTTNYTANTIERIKKMHPFANFIWIMGADNMLHINKWHFSAKIFANVAIAIFDRAEYSYKVISSQAAQTYCNYKISSISEPIDNLNWGFFRIRKNRCSSTEMRKMDNVKDNHN